MPTVPLSSGPTQTLRPLTGERFQAPDVGAGQREIGEGMTRFGQDLGQTAQDVHQIDTIYAEGRAKQLDNQYQAYERDLLFGDDGYYNKQNADALNARATTEQALQKKQAELLAQAQDPIERKMVSDVFSRRLGETLTGIGRYAQGQAKSYATLQSNARISNAQDAYVRFAGSDDPEDQKQAEANRQTILSELASQAQVNGWTDPDILKSKRQAALSDMHVATIRALALNDVTKASAYLEQHKDEMDPVQVHTLNASLLPLEAEHDAKGMADQWEAHGAPLASPTVQQVPGAPAGVVAKPKDMPNADAVFQRMIHVESGGRQLDSRGQPLTSSAGAVGVGQLMPATAHMMQASLGLPVNDDYKTDPALNVQLSRAYFARLLRQFHGDIPRAVAAYNAGPGRVSQDPNWQARLPQETREYLGKVLGPNAVAGGLSAPPGAISDETQAEANYAAGLKWVEDYIPQRLAGKPEQYIKMVQDATRKELRERYDNATIAIKANNDAVEDRVYGQIANLGVGNFTDTSQVADFNGLPAHIRMTLETLANSNRRLQATAARHDTDWTAYSNYRDMPIEQLRKVPVEQLRQDLGDAELHEMIERRTTRKDVNPGQAVTARQVVEYTKGSLSAAGFRVGESKDAAADAPRVAAFTNKLMGWAQGVFKQTGKWPGEEAIRQEGDRELLWGTVPSQHWYSSDQHVRHFEAPEGQNWHVDVPEDEKPRLSAALKRNNQPVTDENIRKLYIASQSHLYVPRARP